MGLDLTKLTAAPWKSDGCNVIGPPEESGHMQIYDEGGHNEADAVFIALARNAFDVMMRRKKWFPVPNGVSWDVCQENGTLEDPELVHAWPMDWPDPFTALVEADKWYKEHVEKIG